MNIGDFDMNKDYIIKTLEDKIRKLEEENSQLSESVEYLERKNFDLYSRTSNRKTYDHIEFGIRPLDNTMKMSKQLS